MWHFIQAGAERYQYEMIKALDKQKYEIDIYALYPLGSYKKNGLEEEYYYPLIKKIVNNIFFNTYDKNLLKRTQNIFSSIFIRKETEKYINKYQLKKFLNSYDIINIRVEDYYWIEKKVNSFKETYIHIMATKMQTFPKSPFQYFNFHEKYNLIADLPTESAEFEFSEFKNGYNFLNFPKIIDTSLISPIEYKPDNQPFKIGIFTRIDYQGKPLTPFFFALHLLIHRGIKVQVHLFGSGDPSGYNRLIKTFSLEESFFFEGHQEDLSICLEKYKLNLAWFQANNYQPGGYAAYELMCRALPNVFWDFQPLNKKRAQGVSPFPCFWEVEKLADYTQMLLENPLTAKKLGESQREHVIKHQDTKNHIHILENAFDNI